ncbi:ATP-binding protein [Paenibacillus sabuli]|nr:ATP-binding protein [Paenibacillus sabuli]
MSRRRLPSVQALAVAGIVLLVLHQGVLLLFAAEWLLHAVTLAGGLLVLLAVLRVYRAFHDSWAPLAASGQVGSVVQKQRMPPPDPEPAGSDQLAMAGMLAAGIAHEIRNPLTSLRGFLQLLRADKQRYSDIMLAEVDRINEIVNELLRLADPKPREPEQKPLLPLVRSVVTLLEGQANLMNVRMRIETDEAAEVAVVVCEENKLKQVFINLVKNAIEAMPDGGEIELHCFCEGKRVCLQVADRGSGIDVQLADRLGQPFVTTKENGMGLGLMICRSIIEGHKGDLQFDGREHGGTVVTVSLPILR